MSKERIYFVYKYTFPNGKIYIGQTYKSSGRYGTEWGYKTQIVYYAMKKYQNYKKEILEYCTKDNVDERERYYISKYHSMDPSKGYNRDSGGNERKIFSKETKKLISKAHNGQPILQYDLNGKFIQEWEYIEYAADILDIDSKNISACLHGKTGQSGGFQWKFKNDNRKVGKYIEFDNRRKVNQYSLTGKYLKTWNSILDIHTHYGINTAGIIKCCHGIRKKAGEYQWRYYDNNTNDISPHKRKNQTGDNGPNSRPVFQFNLNGEFIKKWGSVISASKALNIPAESIQNNCYKKSKHGGNYIWSYTKIPPNMFSNEEIKKIQVQKTFKVIYTIHNSRKVYQYSMDGKFIKEWRCVKEASNVLHINNANISENARNGARQSAGGYRWSYSYKEYLGKYIKNKPKYTGKNDKKIFQLTINGEIIKEWKSISIASASLKINASSISRVLTGHLNSAGGFKWKYK